MDTFDNQFLLKGKSFTDHDLGLLGGSKNLVGLDISGSAAVTVRGLESLVALTELRELSLAACKLIGDPELQVVSRIRSLEKLDVSLCGSITDVGLGWLAQHSGLRSLALNFCYSITDDGLLSLSGVSGLNSLSLRSCEQITDAGIGRLQRLALKDLDLPDFASITDDSLATLSQITTLRRLRMANLKHISDDGFQMLQQLKSIEHLVLEHLSGLTDRVLDCFDGMSSLRTLEIAGCGGLNEIAIFEFARKHETISFTRRAIKAPRRKVNA
jgi:Leucine Rich Repeat (LRR) protein